MRDVDKGGGGRKTVQICPPQSWKKPAATAGQAFAGGGPVARAFSEKWNLLPYRPAIAAGCGQILPGDKCIPAKPAGMDFPGRRKFDA
jgi:hypothetical protein